MGKLTVVVCLGVGDDDGVFGLGEDDGGVVGEVFLLVWGSARVLAVLTKEAEIGIGTMMGLEE